MPQSVSEAPAAFVNASTVDESWGRLALVNATDTEMRMAAFERVSTLASAKGVVGSADLDEGFTFGGERVPIYNPRRGIFRPRQMAFPLSIRTVYPKKGNRVWYDDQSEAHRQIFGSTDAVDYAFMGGDPDHMDNRGLVEAATYDVPLIYFLGVSPGLYQPIFPVFVAEADRQALRARITFAPVGASGVEAPETPQERRYALRTVKQRLHQAQFREAVLLAYGGRCAFSGLPATQLLDAAHIIADRDEALGQPLVVNGLPVSKVHHAAFDSHLIGVDQDRRIHVSRRLLDLNDGPVLESMKALAGTTLRPPRRPRDAPDPDRLAERFKLFKAAA